jgi:hypothetical protein
MLVIIAFIFVSMETCLSRRYQPTDNANMSRWLQNFDFWNGVY